MRGHEHIVADRLKRQPPLTIWMEVGEQYAKPWMPRNADSEDYTEAEIEARDHPTVYTGASEPIEHDLRFLHGMNVVMRPRTDDVDLWQRWVSAVAAVQPWVLTVLADDEAMTYWLMGKMAGQELTTKRGE